MEKKAVGSVRSQVSRPVHIEPLYDSHEVAAQYRVSEKSLHRWARKGIIPAVKCGRL